MPEILIEIDERVIRTIDACAKRNGCDCCLLQRECHQLWDKLVGDEKYEA